MRRYLHLDADESGLGATLELVLSRTGFAGVAVTLVDETTRYPFCAVGSAVLDVAPRSLTACELVVEAGKPVVLVRAAGQEPVEPVLSRIGLGTYVGVPLTGGEGAFIGALCLVDAAERQVPGSLLSDLVVWAGIVQDQLELLRRRTEASLPPASRNVALGEAVESGQIVPWYQPIVDLGTGVVVGYEALARWEHPTRGVLAPAVFLPEAEDSELIIDLDLAILDRAGRDLARWQAAHPAAALRVNVNLSTRHLGHDDCVDRLTLCTTGTGTEPSSVSLELTEHLEISPTHHHAQFLQALRDQGFAVLLDDLGSGWSHLEHLVHLPIDGFKIDRTITSTLGRPAGDAVVTALAGVGAALGISTTVEGVETGDTAERARAAGVLFGQGYLWGPAVAADQVDHTVGTVL